MTAKVVTLPGATQFCDASGRLTFDGARILETIQDRTNTQFGGYMTDAAVTASLATKQPLDSDLTAIAALTTATFGRSALTWVDAAAGRAALSVYSSAQTDSAITTALGPYLLSTTAASTYQPVGSYVTYTSQTLTTPQQAQARTNIAAQVAGSYPTGSGTCSGTNTGDQTITLTGDVTGSGTGSFAATIGANKVTLAQMAQVVTATFLGRTTASTGNVEALTVSQAKGLLNLTGTNSGDQTITLTGDVTGSGTGSFAATIGANKVTLAQMATVATATFLGRTTAATGNVEALTTAQAKTLLNLTGTNSGDQTITLTGDVTGSGTGSFAATLATAQPAAHTWAVAQTFTVAPVFTDQSGSRTALGLGTLATQSGTFSGTSSGTNTGDQTLASLAAQGTASKDVSGGYPGFTTGTWTPTVAYVTPGTSSFAYATQTGTYTIVGDLVFLEVQLNFTPTIGTGTGDIVVSGVPVAAAAAGAFGVMGNMVAGWTWPAGRTMAVLRMTTTTTIIIQGNGTGVINSNFGAANMTTGVAHIIRGSIVYKKA